MKNKDLLEQIYEKWWVGYKRHEIEGTFLRHAFHLDLIIQHKGTNIEICDLGGGWGAFSAAAAALGIKSILIDDFGDTGFFDFEDPRHQMAGHYGFERIDRDMVKDGIDFPPESMDVFTSFDSMEHWHASPKKMFHQCMDALRPGGLFLLGVPNCVNLRKRITVPLGRGKWSSMNDWYETAVFRGHVREPDAEDLRYIAKDMGLSNVQILGRNWLGYSNTTRVIRMLTPLLDLPLRFFPAFCSDIYLLGRKPSV